MRMTDLQLVCLYALEEMTLKKLNKLYFDDGGIGYTKNVIGGQARPADFVQKMYYERFPKKYQDKVKEKRRIEAMPGW